MASPRRPLRATLNPFRTRSLACAAALAMSVMHATPADATFIVVFNNSTDYSVTVNFVPDLDQRRATLPNNGKMYCVPTSATNWAAYVANHGAPFVLPGPHPYAQWQSSEPGPFEFATNHIALMGLQMNTNATNGTGPSKAIPGLKQRFPSSHFLIMSKHPSLNSIANFDQVAAWMKLKVPVIAVMGWYQQTPGPKWTTVTRDGGHAVALAHVKRNGSTRTAGFRDPASAQNPPHLLIQSQFKTDPYNIVPTLVFNTKFQAPFVMDKIEDYGSGYLDGYYAIVPLFALTGSSGGFGNNATLTIKNAFTYSWDNPQNQEETIPLTGFNQPLLDIKPGVLTPDLYLVMQQDFFALGHVVKYDPATKQVSTVLTGGNPRRVAFNGGGEWMYLIDQGGNRVRRYDMTSNPPVLWNSFNLPFNVSAITFDDVAKEVVMLSVSEGAILRYNEQLAGPPTAHSIPPDFMLAGDGSVTINPLDGGIWFTSAGSNALYRLVPGEMIGNWTKTLAFADGSVNQARGLSASDNGDLFFSSQGLIRQWRILGEFPDYELVQVFDSPFAGLAATNVFHFPQSRTNYDPAVHDDLDFDNVFPDFEITGGVADCFGDLNLDGVVGVPDLLMLLGQWGNCYGCAGDLTATGAVGVPDLLTLLSNWGPCPR